MSKGTVQFLPAPAAEMAVGILDALSHPVIVVDAGNNIIFANSTAEAFFSASRSYLTREKLERILPFGSPVFALVEQVRADHASVNEYRVDVSSPRIGPDRVADVHGSPMNEQTGSVCLMFRERTMAEKIDRQMTHRAAARSVTGLASMLAHEIKNPLSGIRGAAQLLERAVSPEDKALTQLIKDETDRIVALVDRMEVFSDERPIERFPVNIHLVLNHVKAVAEAGFAKDIEFVELFDPSLPLVTGNRDQLIQVFLNLVKNAAEACMGSKTKRITLTTAYRPGMRLSLPGSSTRMTLPLEFCVTDTGSGISPDLIPHMFDPFITTKTNGSGLGLALVAKIVGDHGGTIECDSQPGRTTFRILMPAFQDETGRSITPATTPEPAGARP
ncbi:MAG: nitrogen regulation protein NR(II) [Rhizobiaceae bacterium]|jgi:two-component system nitrogen regulation sensor histidine kinase GlnL|nr:nitrogen regulation protein NR(II) [Rhizobiaceae bacterium]